MQMTGIAVIGFGSLIWDIEILSPHVKGNWKMYEGPTLPLEFSLISKKRLYALALVIDHINGAKCPTCIIDSKRASIYEARQDLAIRERTPIEMIGYFDKKENKSHSTSIATTNQISNWLDTVQYDAAIWTDCKTNFESLTGKIFTARNALDYLYNLPESGKTEAKKYILNAPDKVSTPLRKLFNESIGIKNNGMIKK